MLKTLPFVLFTALIFGCQKDDFEFDLPKNGFPTHSVYTLEGDADLQSIFKSNGQVFIPNCFTPNDLGVDKNNSIKPVFTFLNEFDWRGMTIYNHKKEEVAHTKKNETWNGKLETGEVIDDTYIFKAKLVYIDERELFIYGAFCLRTCFTEKDDYKAAFFPDMLHPVEGFIFPTQEEILFCN